MAAEALACGCPTILLEGQEDKPASAKCFDSPQSMADAIVSLWERIKADPEGERGRARKIAEKNYDIKDTIKALLSVVDRLV